MRFSLSFGGQEREVELRHEQVTVGRARGGNAPELDLTPDRSVSRPHARIWRAGEDVWIEDVGSKSGTWVNGENIVGRRGVKIRANDVVVIGETTLRLLPEAAATVQATPADLPVAAPGAGAQLRIELAAPVLPHTDGAHLTDRETAARLGLLYGLPLQLVSEGRISDMLNLIAAKLVEAIPHAARAAVLLRQAPTDELRLKAHFPSGGALVSNTLVRRAMNERRGFIWSCDDEVIPINSLSSRQIHVGMYVPLVWQEQVLGCLTVDNPARDAVFTPQDLQLMTAVANYAAMAIANHDLQERLRAESSIRANLLRQFSPKVASRMLEHRGRLQLGGNRSEVTILCSDIRGFTRATQNMEPDDVVDLINDYLSVLAPVIFEYEGTVDKYIGDGILAVFGSPEPDPRQQLHAAQAALAMQEAVRRLNETRATDGAKVCQVGIGVHTGEVLHGFIGTSDRMEFTVIGDAVNMASRYCDGAPGGEIILSPEMHEHIWQEVEVLPREIKTKHEGPLPAYQLRAMRAGPQ